MSTNWMRQKVIQVLARTPVLRQALILRIVHGQIAMNRRLGGATAKKTPWVFDCDFDLDGRVEYIERVVSDYLQVPGIPVEAIHDASMLEVGPGESFGVALKFLSLGAKRVICTDRFDSLLPPSLQWEIYEKLIARMNPQERKNIDGAIRFESGQIILDPNRLQYLSRSIDEITFEYSPETFDIIISRAVLEHVFQIDTAMEALDEVLCQGGWAVHEIDFRDHGIFTGRFLHPLTMFTLDADVWDTMSSNTGAPNRRLLSYFQKFYSGKGYSNRTVITRFFGAEELFQRRTIEEAPKESARIKKWIKKNSKQIKIPFVEEDLLIAAAFLVSQKCRKTDLTNSNS